MTLCLLIVGLVACTNKESGNTENDPPIVNNGDDKKDDVDTRDAYEKLLDGDFSGVAGEYVNIKGKTIILLADGTLEKQVVTHIDINKNINDNDFGLGVYVWNTWLKNQSSFINAIYPIGVPIDILSSNGYDENDEFMLKTAESIAKIDDLTKIRFFWGTWDRAYPEPEDIYFKK